MNLAILDIREGIIFALLHSNRNFSMRQSLFILLFFIGQLHAQTAPNKPIKFEEINLRSPLDIPLILAGNFGEMRSNHFHTGIDIKTQGVEGFKVYAVEDGYISRVRISEWGYGKALYVDHPNGLTTVYAHLSAFPEKIHALVYGHQKKNEAFQIDEQTLADSVFVKKGEVIAFSGNSGGSTAPHLHFEIRETTTEHALNPLLFACYRKEIGDHIPPQITGIKFYAVSDQGYMIPGKSTYYKTVARGNKLVINAGKPIDVSALHTLHANLAFGLHATDKLDAAYNVCGIHHTTLIKDNHKIVEQQIDYINFDHNRYLNSHQDYYSFKQERKNIHKQFKTDHNPLNIYILSEGIIPWDKIAGNYHFDVVDVHKNKSTIDFEVAPISGVPQGNPLDKIDRYYFPDSVNTLLTADFQVLMEPFSFYEPMQKVFKRDSNTTYLSPIFQFGEDAIPLQERYDIRIKAPEMGANFNYQKLAVIHIDDKNRVNYEGGYYVNGWVEVSPKTFGKFTLSVDTIPPKINPLDFKEGQDISRYSTLELSIEDDLAGILEFKAYINGKWVLMNFDKRKKRYIIPLDKEVKPVLRNGENSLRISAEDYKGNLRENSYTLIYNPGN
jgi:murein DD-endopeptidase MepM/ murein hydrolase activator NlpD